MTLPAQLKFANAPVSWGIWGKNSLPEGRTSKDILDALTSVGYDGVELGPLGFFGEGNELADTLAAANLECAGIYVPLRIFDGQANLDEDMANLRTAVKVIASLGNTGPIILAEETTDALKKAVARGRGPHPLDLDTKQWDRLIDVIEEGRQIIENAGLTASLHPHGGTHIDQPWETDRVLENVKIGLTIDTGHAAAGGDDIFSLLNRWHDRINHVHIKDIVRGPILEAKRTGTTFGIASASVPLGKGELLLDYWLKDLIRTYRGWIVIEQDRRPDGGHDHSEVDKEQQENLKWLKEHL